MRALLQRVSRADVAIDGETVAEIGQGLLVLLGVMGGDSEKDARFLADKIVGLRIFEDENGKMNRSLVDIEGQALVVSQFTLGADARHGRRPSFIAAAKPPLANELYERFTEELAALLGHSVETGRFGADMKVTLTNDGPVTIWLDTKELRGEHDGT